MLGDPLGNIPIPKPESGPGRDRRSPGGSSAQFRFRIRILQSFVMISWIGSGVGSLGFSSPIWFHWSCAVPPTSCVLNAGWLSKTFTKQRARRLNDRLQTRSFSCAVSRLRPYSRFGWFNPNYKLLATSSAPQILIGLSMQPLTFPPTCHLRTHPGSISSKHSTHTTTQRTQYPLN